MLDHRSTLALELRDGLLQDLVATSLMIEVARRALPDGTSANARERLATAASTIQHDIEEVRRVIMRLQARAAA
ncbi:MAG: histidine kinase [Dehalococcoidia bacterium]|nr:histidine kinase [Dehalococcoidia bacterium]